MRLLRHTPWAAQASFASRGNLDARLPKYLCFHSKVNDICKPSRELTNPTWGKGKSSQNGPVKEDMWYVRSQEGTWIIQTG